MPGPRADHQVSEAVHPAPPCRQHPAHVWIAGTRPPTRTGALLMTTFAQAAALLGVAGTAVIYGTDVFSALVLRPRRHPHPATTLGCRHLAPRRSADD